MNENLFLKICEIYQLGELITSPELIHMGLLNIIWKITTQKGKFAIKEIKSQQILKSQDYIHTEQIASLMKQNNIPAITALTAGNGTLQIIDNIKLLVFNWIEGKTLSLKPVTATHAKMMGNVFAKIHLLNVKLPERVESANHYLGSEKWHALIKMAITKRAPFADQLNLNIEKLLMWESLYQKSYLKLLRNEIISHRDLNPKNAIWINETTPFIIDWEWAGLVNPTMEIISAAYEWSGMLINQFDQQIFSTFLQGYYQGGTKMNDAPQDALHNSLGKWLAWLALNIELACQDLPAQDIIYATREVEKTLYLLENLMSQCTIMTDIACSIHEQYDLNITSI